MSDEKPMGQVIQIDEGRIRDHLGEMVRGTVEETLNAMLDAEADQLCGAGRYERSQARQDTRAGSYDRTLQTSAGEVDLKIPKLRRQTFETAIIERYRRRESSVEESLIEMYLAGISVRRVEDITEALWGTRVSPTRCRTSTRRSTPRSRHGGTGALKANTEPLSRWHRDEADLGGEVHKSLCWWPAPLIGRVFGRFPGICEGAKEDKSAVGVPAPPRRPRPQRRAAHHLRRLPGLDGECRGISARRSVAAQHGSFLSERLQPCAGNQGPRGEPHVKAIHAQENRDAADRKARTIVEDLRAAKMHTAADLVERSVSETLTYYAFPDIHWQKILRTNNPLERIMKEIRRRTRVVGAFPDGPSCLNLAAARLRYIAGTAWSAKCYMNMRPLYQPQVPQTGASPDPMCERICTLPRRQGREAQASAEY